MNIGQGLKSTFKTLTLTASIGLIFSVSIPQNSFAHGSIPSPPSYPPSGSRSGRPPILPIVPMNIQALRQRLDEKKLGFSERAWDALSGYDEDTLGKIYRGLVYLHGPGHEVLPAKRSENLLNWILSTLNHNQELQHAMSDAEWYNYYSPYVEALPYAITGAKVAVTIAVVVFTPAGIPLLIANEAIAGNVETAATGVGEFTAALQDGFTVENVVRGTAKATFTVAVKLATGKFVNVVIPIPSGAPTDPAALKALGGDVIAQILASQASGDVAAEAQNLITSPSKSPSVDNGLPTYHYAPPVVDNDPRYIQPYYH